MQIMSLKRYLSWRNFFPYPCLTFIILFLFSFSGCKIGKNKPEINTISKSVKVLIYIRKTPCYGKCPAYEATFYDNGQVLYNGNSNVPLLGRYLYTVPVTTAVGFQNQARRIKYHKMLKSWMVNVDLPSTITEILYDGMTTKIEAQGNAPDDLKKLQEQINKAVMAMTEEQPGKKLPEEDESLGPK